MHVTANKLTICKKSYQFLSCTRPYTNIAILNKYRLLHTYSIKTPLYWHYMYIHTYIYIKSLRYFLFLIRPSSGSLIYTVQWQVQNTVTGCKIQHSQQRVVCYAEAVHYSVFNWYEHINCLVISKRCSKLFTSLHDSLLLFIADISLHVSSFYENGYGFCVAAVMHYKFSI